MINTII